MEWPSPHQESMHASEGILNFPFLSTTGLHPRERMLHGMLSPTRIPDSQNPEKKINDCYFKLLMSGSLLRVIDN